jgi:hypothetical protein
MTCPAIGDTNFGLQISDCGMERSSMRNEGRTRDRVMRGARRATIRAVNCFVFDP